MKMVSGQRGVALFTAVFLIVAVGGLAVSVGLISGQQQLTTVQTLDQTRAYYAARARLDREIGDRLGPGGTDCPPGPFPADEDPIGGFTTVLDDCDTTEDVNEGGAEYDIHEIDVRAYRGSPGSGSLVQRSIRVQITDTGGP